MIELINKDANTLVSWGFSFPMYFKTTEEIYIFLDENAEGIPNKEKFCIIDWENKQSTIIEVERVIKMSFTFF